MYNVDSSILFLVAKEKCSSCIVGICSYINLLAESKKGINAVQRCSFQNQKGAVARLCTAIAPFCLYRRVLSPDFVQQLCPSGSQRNMVEKH